MIRAMFQMAVAAWNISPGEFWRLCVCEWWWLYDAKTDFKDERMGRLQKMLEGY